MPPNEDATKTWHISRYKRGHSNAEVIDELLAKPVTLKIFVEWLVTKPGCLRNAY
jgi:hypothetical protein